MSLPSDWYVDKGEANHALSQQHQLNQETARLMLELVRLMHRKKAQEPPLQGEIINAPLPPELVAVSPSGEDMEAQVLYEAPILTGSDVPLIEPEILPDYPALPCFQHRPDQIAADTAQLLVNHLGNEGVYQAEGYTIRREEQVLNLPVTLEGVTMEVEETRYRVWDNQQNEIFTFRDAGPGQGYDIIKDEMLPDDLSVMLKARYAIERDGLESIMGDRTFNKQIGSLGDLAPIGSQAANFAHYALDGYEANTLKTPKYEISRDAEGNVTIAENPSAAQKIANKVLSKPAYTASSDGAPTTAETIHNPSGQVLLRTEEGRVTTFNMGAKDQQNFAKLFRASMDKPLNQVVTPPARAAKVQIDRD